MRMIVTLVLETHTDVLYARRNDFGAHVADTVQNHMAAVARADCIHVAPVELKKSYHTRRKERELARRAAA